MVEPKLPRQSDADRGQVGIETLIIFIAMILVAAVAAGVLINTAGFLQNKASATSQESQKQVSNQVIVISGTGNVNASSGSTQGINAINVTVMQSPGSDAIDLNATTVEIIGPNGEATLTHKREAAASSLSKEKFNVSAEKDPDNSVPVLNEKEDRFVISIPLGDLSGNNFDGPQDSLNTGQEMTIKIVTQSGSQYVYVANVPDTLASHDAGEAVSL